MNKQAAFDNLVQAIIDQGGPSVSTTGACRYRGMDGRKCAVGFLIPDHIYRKSMEGKSYQILRDKFLELDLVPAIDTLHTLLPALQSAHDSAAAWYINNPDTNRGREGWRFGFLNTLKRILQDDLAVHKLKWNF